MGATIVCAAVEGCCGDPHRMIYSGPVGHFQAFEVVWSQMARRSSYRQFEIPIVDVDVVELGDFTVLHVVVDSPQERREYRVPSA